MTAVIDYLHLGYTMLGFESDIYRYFNDLAPYLNMWLAAFVLGTLVRVGILIQSGGKTKIHNSLLGEAAGLLLTVNHSVCFVKAIMAGDVVSALVFTWWGPGFLVMAYIFIQSKRGALDFDWSKLGLATSLACKLCYLVFMVIYAYLECYAIIYTFSLWIVHDQICQAWFCDNADRARRTTEDFWLVRLMYPAGLFIPCFVDMPYGSVWCVLGFFVFLFWVVSLLRVARQGRFHKRPEGSFLRDIVYLSKSSSN